METRAIGRSRRQTSYEFYKKLSKLTIGAGAAFWAITIATSLLPIAAEYRSASSFSHSEVLIGSLPAGLFIGFCVSYALIRFFDKIPARNPILKSIILSVIALVIASVVPFVRSDSLHYFLVGAALDVPRFLLLGIVVGYLYKRLYGTTA